MKQLVFIALIFSHLLPNPSPEDQLDKAWQNLISNPNFKNASISLLVKNVADGSEIFSRNEDMGLASASTLKVITSATAFELLGKDFNYKTRIACKGTISNGVLYGDLIIKGSGDPTFGTWRYSQTKEQEIINFILKKLQQAGIQTINGHVLIDERIMDGEVIPDGWIWQDIGNYYGAGARAFNWRENQYDLFLKSGTTIGSAVTIAGTNPYYVSGLQLKSQLKSAKEGSGDNAYIYLPLFGNTGFVRGTIGKGK